MIFSVNGQPLHLTNADAIIAKNFDGEDLTQANLRGWRLEGATFCDALMDGVDLSGADCYGASFYRARLKGAILRMGVFKGADFRLADLRGADLSGADFESPGVAATDFCHANLEGVICTGAKFFGAAYEQGTSFPLGFDPNMHGMKMLKTK